VSASSFTVQRVLGLATLQDLGRHGQMHLAVPPGGALVPELLVAANRSVGNADDATGIEVQGRLSIGSAHDIDHAIDDRPPGLWRAGETLDVSSGSRRCAYLAIRGGLAGRGAILCTGDEPLRAGDVVSSADHPLIRAPVSRFVDGDTVTVIAGPDLDAFADEALAVLASAPYRILPASNRVGTRLAGPALPRRAEYRERSRPMVRGALEVPRDGQPIVLGPEHPTSGGYPVIGVIASAELGRFHAIRLGGSVRFLISSR
jgi:allophanate hydrolase subunit 2